MNAANLYITSTIPTFTGRMKYYLIGAAIDVMAEAPETANHANRIAFAKKVLTGAYDQTIVAFAVLANPGIAQAANEAAILDGDINYQINAVFNALSNAAAS